MVDKLVNSCVVSEEVNCCLDDIGACEVDVIGNSVAIVGNCVVNEVFNICLVDSIGNSVFIIVAGIGVLDIAI